MEMKLKTKICLVIIINLVLLIVLYQIPRDSKLLTNICLIKNITGKGCWNCGMTRAFLSVLHWDFYSAYQYNAKVIITFPLTVGIYLYSIYQYLFRRRGKKDE